jgi:hypothetical protein
MISKLSIAIWDLFQQKSLTAIYLVDMTIILGKEVKLTHSPRILGWFECRQEFASEAAGQPSVRVRQDVQRGEEKLEEKKIHQE